MKKRMLQIILGFLALVGSFVLVKYLLLEYERAMGDGPTIVLYVGLAAIIIHMVISEKFPYAITMGYLLGYLVTSFTSVSYFYDVGGNYTGGDNHFKCWMVAYIGVVLADLIVTVLEKRHKESYVLYACVSVAVSLVLSLVLQAKGYYLVDGVKHEGNDFFFLLISTLVCSISLILLQRFLKKQVPVVSNQKADAII